jgi:glyoxylase-like metal-dependent hydrolase (beta-lactamase superfamily II)
MKKLQVFFIAFFAWTAAASAQGIPFDKINIFTIQLSPHFYILTGTPNVDPGHPEGAGGWTGVFVGPEGIVMVDCSYAPLSDKILASIRKISNAPIRILIDTHEHPDHTGGNPNFAKLGAMIFAREEAREVLAQPFSPAVAAAFRQAASDTDPARLPIVTFGSSSNVKLYLNGETIDLIPFPAAHTNGDVMVKFEKEDVIMIGDFYRNYGYPFIDAGHGGSIKGTIAALDTLMKAAGPETKLVPGHGSVITKASIPFYRDMIIAIGEKVKQLIVEGKTKEQVIALKLTSEYDSKVRGGTDQLPGGTITSADRFVGAIYTEIKTGTP